MDEWYHFQGITNPSVGGGGTDVSPRGLTPIHVLLTVDESTYNESDGNTTDDDHPVSWCKRFDGGRMFYTALGHTNQSFSEAPFLQHLLNWHRRRRRVRVRRLLRHLQDRPRTAAPAAPWPPPCR